MAAQTTVRLPEGLLDRAKRKAAAEGSTLTSLIEDGLRLMVAGERKAAGWQLTQRGLVSTLPSSA